MKTLITNLLLIGLCAILLGMSVRGIAGTPTSADMNDNKWKEQGPFELSPERGRFALTLSLIENHSFQFSLPIARFATPDLGYNRGEYVSLFAPGVSYLVIPGYMVGKWWGVGQVGVYAVIALFAIANMVLIRTIAQRLGAHSAAASIAALTFLFATPSYAYAVTLYQHHISTFLLLLSLYLVGSTTSLVAVFPVAFLFAAAIPIDYPNLFFLMPVAILAGHRILRFLSRPEGIWITFRPLGIIAGVAGLLLPMAFFFWFNQQSYHNPFQFSGTVKQIQALTDDGKPAGKEKAPIDASKLAKDEDEINAPGQPPPKKSAVGFFKTRNMLQGFYIHFLSPDRGVLWYAPVMLFGIWGAVMLYRKNQIITALLVACIGANILLYSMWGDPWGGWAFGSRYLIPSYALASIFLAIFLTRWKKNGLILSLFFLVLCYSIAVNTAGAITSNRNPPQVEVLALEKLSGQVQKYTVDRNLDMLRANSSKSFLFQTLGHRYFTAWQYYLLLSILIMALCWLLLIGVTL